MQLTLQAIVWLYQHVVLYKIMLLCKIPNVETQEFIKILIEN